MPRLAPLVNIADYHVDATASLRLYYSNSHAEYVVRFATYRPREVTEEFAERLQETEMRSTLAVLARVEAAFRQDYKVRGRSKMADPISVDFRKIFRTRGDRVRLDDEILETWRRHIEPMDRVHIGQLRGMFKYRHWLAHGRYWEVGRQHAFADVYLLADAILSTFDLKC